MMNCHLFRKTAVYASLKREIFCKLTISLQNMMWNNCFDPCIITFQHCELFLLSLPSVNMNLHSINKIHNFADEYLKIFVITEMRETSWRTTFRLGFLFCGQSGWLQLFGLNSGFCWCVCHDSAMNI